MDNYFLPISVDQPKAPFEIEKFKQFLSEFINLGENLANLTKEIKIKKERYKDLTEAIKIVMTKMKIEKIKTERGVLMLKSKKHGFELIMK